MNSEQKRLFEVFKATLILMAVNDSLPSDLTQLKIEDFEEGVKTYNEENKERFRAEKASQYLSMEIDEIIRVLAEIEESEVNDNQQLDYSHDDIVVIEKFENSFLVGQFFNEIED